MNASLRVLLVGIPLAIVAFLWVGLRGAAVDERDTPLPPLPLATLDGSPVPASTFAGKPWVINLWMPECAPCIREIPALVEARHTFEPRGVGFLAVSVAPQVDRIQVAIATSGFDWPQALTTGDLMRAVDVLGVPSTLFVSADGRLVGVSDGAIDSRTLHEEIGRLLDLHAS